MRITLSQKKSLQDSATKRFTHYLVKVKKLGDKLDLPAVKTRDAQVYKAKSRVNTQLTQIAGLNLSSRVKTATTKEILRNLEFCEQSEPERIGQVFGCEDPAFVVKTEEMFWTSLQIKEWHTGPKEPYVVSGCGKCRACIRRKSAGVASMAQLDFRYGAREQWLITRTFCEPAYALGMQFHVKWNKDFRRDLKKYYRRRGAEMSWSTAQEFGAEKGRRHFHDTLTGDIDPYVQALNGEVVPDDDMPGAFAVIPKQYWPYGYVHFQPVQDLKGAAYGAKYAFKGQSLAFDPDLRRERHLLLQKEPLQRSYFQYPGGGLGQRGLKKYLSEHGERLIDETRKAGHDPLSVLEDQLENPTGIYLEPDPEETTRKQEKIPVALRQQDRKIVNQYLEARLNYGELDAAKVGFQAMQSAAIEQVVRHETTNFEIQSTIT